MTTALYRHFDAEGTLLYVGITNDLEKRTSQHKARSAWFPDVARTTSETPSSRGHAAALERVAIRFEKPLFNKISKPNHKPVSASASGIGTDVAQGLGAIEAYAEEAGMKVASICQYAVQNRNAFDRLARGTGHRKTLDRILSWIEMQREAAS